MSEFTDGIGQAVFVRTDVPGYEEVKVPFRSLEELMAVCATPRDSMMLEKVIVYASAGGAAVSLMLGYIACSRRQREPGELKPGDSSAEP